MFTSYLTGSISESHMGDIFKNNTFIFNIMKIIRLKQCCNNTIPMSSDVCADLVDRGVDRGELLFAAYPLATT